MPKSKALLFLMVSLIVSFFTVWAAVRWVNRQVAARVTHQTVNVVVATRPVMAGEPLNARMLKTIGWPVREPLVGGFSDTGQLNSRVAIDDIAIGEPVLESHLAPQGSKAGLSALIASGKRGMSVHVTDVTGVAGFALPGTRVDVLVSFQDEQNHMVSRIILQDIRVLAVAQDMSVKDDTKAKVVNVVTLEVGPEQAETLDLAKALGALSLVLRNQSDKQYVVTAGVRKSGLLLGSPAPLPSPKPHKVFSGHVGPVPIELIRGTVRASVSPQ